MTKGSKHKTCCISWPTDMNKTVARGYGYGTGNPVLARGSEHRLSGISLTRQHQAD